MVMSLQAAYRRLLLVSVDRAPESHRISRVNTAYRRALISAMHFVSFGNSTLMLGQADFHLLRALRDARLMARLNAEGRRINIRVFIIIGVTLT